MNKTYTLNGWLWRALPRLNKKRIINAKQPSKKFLSFPTNVFFIK